MTRIEDKKRDKDLKKVQAKINVAFMTSMNDIETESKKDFAKAKREA